jgi:hypothetical protein
MRVPLHLMHEWQSKFLIIANDFFAYQMSSLRSILYRKIKVMAKLLDIEEEITYPENEAMIYR